MDNHDYHWHWWHWLIIIAVVLIGLGIAYTWINNYDIVKENDQSYMRGIEETIEHPIDTTQNAVTDLTK